MLCRGTLKYGLLVSAPDDADGILQNEAADNPVTGNLDNLLIINMADDTPFFMATRWDGELPAAVAETPNWKLIQYGVSIGMGPSSILSGNNFDVDTAGTVSETISIQQTSARRLDVRPVLQIEP